MPYSTNTTIVTLLPGLPQSSGAQGWTQNQARIDSHISRADNLINAKIGNRYDVSEFDTSGSVPPLCKTLSEDIASWFTYRSEFSGDNQNDNEWTDKFKMAIEMLDQIRDGEMDLLNTAGSLIEERATNVFDLIDSNTKNYTPFFDEDGPTEWKVDDDKLDSIEDDRS